MNNLTTAQIEKIQLDSGIIYLNYGTASQLKLAPTRGGGEFSVLASVRDIEYDGRMGKTKGMRVTEEINAMLKVGVLNMSQDTLALALAKSGSKATNPSTDITNDTGGIIASAKYQTNVTMFAKTADGKYKVITLYNALADNDFTMGTTDKGEAVVNIEFAAHWDPTDQTTDIYKVDDITAIVDPYVP